MTKPNDGTLDCSCSEFRTIQKNFCQTTRRRIACETPMQNLTRRERELATFVAAGFSNQQIAELLHIRRQTVKNHVQAVYRKLHVKNRVELCLQITGAKVEDIQRFLAEGRVAAPVELPRFGPSGEVYERDGRRFG